MASASRESVFGVQTNTARKIHRSDHTEGRLTTAPSGCCIRKGTGCGHSASIRLDNLRRQRQKLLEALYADTITVDHLKAEQRRIAGEPTAAEQHLAQADAQTRRQW